MSGARPDTWMPRWVTASMPYDAALPAAPGVYVVFYDSEPVYVGQSNNLRVRVARHNIRFGYARNIITPWGDFPDTTKVTLRFRVSRRLGDWAMWEIRLISRLHPRFNSTFSGVRWNGAAK